MLNFIRQFVLIGLLLYAANGDAKAAQEKRVALVVGNAAYSNISQLKKPIADAQAVASALTKLGYQVILGTDASKAELENLLAQFKAIVKDADVGIFYFSGHGFQTNRANQQHPVNHVVPIDFRIEENGPTLATLALDDIIATLKSSARVGLVFMDACRNDPQLAAASLRSAGDSKTVTISRGFSPVNVLPERPAVPRPAGAAPIVKGPTGLLIAYATDPGNIALEGEQGPLSPFTGALVKHMNTPRLSIAEIMGRVSADVATATQGEQTPWSVASLTAGAYQFAPSVAGAAGPGAGSAGAAKPSTAGPRRQRAATSVRRSGGGQRGSSLPPNLGVGVGAGL